MHILQGLGQILTPHRSVSRHQIAGRLMFGDSHLWQMGGTEETVEGLPQRAREP